MRRALFSYQRFLQKIGRPFFVLLVLLTKVAFWTLHSIKPPNFNIGRLAVSAFVTIILLIAGSYIFFLNIIYNLPSPETLSNRQLDTSTKIYDRNGILLYTVYKDVNRTSVKFSDIPNHIKLATLAAEDADFYSHRGFSLKGIARSVKKYFATGELTGGSTITQQLVKNAILTPEKTLARKLRELILAIGVEHKYSKDEILTMYLNEIPYGGTAYGVREAARVYFDKELSEIDIAEAALLAGLTKSPTRYSPFGSAPESAKTRQEEILSLMERRGFITKDQLEREKSKILKYAQNKIEIKAPHFVMYVKDQLSREFGEESLETGGYEVYTTLDYKLQLTLEKLIKDEVNALQRLKVSNGAGIIVDVKTGEILAMVGSVDYFASEGNVNVTLRERQPGSSIKPINYAYAFDHGFTPASVIDDSPVHYKIEGQKNYVPKNYDGKFRGRLTLRSALAESRNIPAVKILESFGVEKMIKLGKELGITTWEDKNRFGLSLTLGGGEVKLIDMSQVYQVFANRGTRLDLTSVYKIRSVQGETIKESCSLKESCEGIRILRPEVAYQITSILSDNKARTPAFGEYSTLVVKGHPEVAVKTGTSNDLRDNLTIGYNQDYVVAIWVGNNDNSPMSRIASGVTGASSIWNKTMSALLAGKPSIAWEVPSNLAQHSVCGVSGRYEEWFIQGTYQDNCKNIRTAENKEEEKDKNDDKRENKRREFN